jgi:hypothetical protein
MSYAAKRPDIEIKRAIRSGPHRGATRCYATLYRKPLAIWVLGHWIVGGRRVRAAWAAVEREQAAASHGRQRDGQR